MYWVSIGHESLLSNLELIVTQSTKIDVIIKAAIDFIAARDYHYQNIGQ